MKLFSDFDFSHVRGSVVIIDIDGTLISDGESTLSSQTLQKVQILKQNNSAVYFCSNKKDDERNQKIAKAAGVEFLNIRKPRANFDDSFDIQKAPMVVIGDKILTDGIFARRIGASFIKIKRLISGNDSFFARLAYLIDDIAYFFIKENGFYLFAVIFIVSIFWLNINAQAEQGVYRFYEIISGNILKGRGFVDSAGQPIFYPLFGYPYLLAILELLFKNMRMSVLFLQGLLALASLRIFYSIFPLQKRFFHLLLFLPFFFLMSVRWSSSISAFLLLLAVWLLSKFEKERRWRFIVLAGFALGLLANFRSEFILLPIFFFFVGLFFRKSCRLLCGIACVLFLAQLLTLLPWTLRAYKLTGHLLFTGANGGHVAYISLGQLPNNVWGIKHEDSAGFQYARQRELSPYSIEADALLKKTLLRKVSENPLEFVKKVVYNGGRVLWGGLYTGEVYTFAVTNDILRQVVYGKTFISIIDYILKNNGIFTAVLLAAHVLLRVIFKFIFLLSWVFMGIFISRKRLKTLTDIFIIAIVLYGFLLMSLMQYTSRHSNGIYLFIIGFVLLFFQERLDVYKKNSSAINWKGQAKKTWNKTPCGVGILPITEDLDYFLKLEEDRYAHYAPWMKDFFNFNQFKGKKVLEIGFGQGTDLAQFALGGAEVYGVDISERHMKLAVKNFDVRGLKANLRIEDAAELSFDDNFFDVVYSFGVLHHTPHAAKCIAEAYRALKPGGTLIVVLYHKYSAAHVMCTLLTDGILLGKLFTLGYQGLLSTIEGGADGIMIKPFVRMYTKKRLRRMLGDFKEIKIKVKHLDRSHFSCFRMLVPNFLIRALEPYFGWYIIATAIK